MASKNLSAEGIEWVRDMTHSFVDNVAELFWEYVEEDVLGLYEDLPEEEARRMAEEDACNHETGCKDINGEFLSWDELMDIYY